MIQDKKTLVRNYSGFWEHFPGKRLKYLSG